MSATPAIDGQAPRVDNQQVINGTPQHTFHIQAKLDTPAAHHESFAQLWHTKWQKPCSMGVYPFMFGAIQDFQPVVDELIANNFKEPYDWDAYAQTFFPKAEELVARAKAAESSGDTDQASELFLRASAVYRISRFPAPRSVKQKYAWEQGKAACLQGLRLRKDPADEVQIPHPNAQAAEPTSFPVYHQCPPIASSSSPAPVMVILTGLDGYRTELAVWMSGWAARGIATLVLEIPGTGDSPADPTDPTSPDRQWTSLLLWISANPSLDAKKVCMWAFSTGGYYAIRAAHTHPDAFAGVVAHGGGCHHMFSPEWLSKVNHLEYPFDLANTLAYKFGFGDGPEALERFQREGQQKFSLLCDGTLDRPRCARLLLVNGTEDEIFPVDDYELCLRHGAPKEARFVADRKHMGEPESFKIILRWLYNIFGIEDEPGKQMQGVPFKAKYP